MAPRLPRFPLVTAIEAVVKSVPKAIAANNAVKEAKAIETQIAKILDKPKVTATDVRKAEALQKEATQVLKDGGVGNKKIVSDVTTAIKEKVADVKAAGPAPKLPVSGADAAKAQSEAKAAAAAKSAAKAQEPVATPKATTPKTAAPKAAAKAPEPVTPPKGVTPKVTVPQVVAGTTAGVAAGVGLGAIGGGDFIPDGNDGATPDGNVTPPVTGGGATDGAGGDGGTGGGGGGAGGGGGDDGGEGGGGGGATPMPIDGGGETVEEPPADDTPAATDTFEKTWLILRAKLIAAGLPVKTVDDSVTYFRNIIKDGTFQGDNEINDVVDQYLYLPTYKSKSGEEIQSPYYRDFGSYNNQLKVPKKPSELVPLVLGYQRLVDKYQVSSKFSERDAIQKYLQNDVSVSELDERMNASRLRGISADPIYLKTLQELGYITGGADLTSFFLDPEIGTLELESRRKSAAFAVEALRRSNAGITLDTASAQASAARLSALGYTEAQVSNLAGQGYENIADQLNPTTALSGMYEKTGEDASALAPVIQKELEAEQFLGMASQRRKKLAEQNVKAFQGQAGISRYGLMGSTANTMI